MKLECLLDTGPTPSRPEDLYQGVAWPNTPVDRPYVYINMAATVDGKVVIGEKDGSSKGVGGPTDQILFRRLQHQCDCALTGSTTIRAGNVIYPPAKPRVTVTRSGKLPLKNRFFTDAPDRAYVFAPEDIGVEEASRIRDSANLIQYGEGDVDMGWMLGWLRRELSIQHLLCEGGPTINAQLIVSGLADELFLTVGPKLKGGDFATICSGMGMPVGLSVPLELISVYRDCDELYLRYRLRNG